MSRYWVYIDGKIQGPAEVPGLRRLAGFNLLSQVCLEGEQSWTLADDVLEIKSYFLAPPRVSSLAMETGNAALQLEPQAAPAPAANAVLSTDSLVEELPPLDAKTGPAKKEPAPAAEGKSGALRALCEVCGYKNPRGVNACMKCGTPIAAGGGETEVLPDTEEPAVPSPEIKPEPALEVVGSGPATPILEHRIIPPSPWRYLGMALAAAGILFGTFVGIHSWKKHYAVKKEMTPMVRLPADLATPAPRTARHSTSRAQPKHKPQRSVPSMEDAQRLPGVSPVHTPSRVKSDEETETPSSYRVIAEATPLKQRHSAPLDSPYAQKRRADKTLWNAQQEQAIRQVQRTRIYGGQRTVQRNVEILLQLLRDREYNTAFETGRRPYLYNDLDWSASIKDGPIYEVRLTFSGGREDDGTPRKPLRFAFNADLERGTVEPGGEENSRNNTMHAFFDESRIPPEERRPIAKDVEELVMAADPEGSPLALDTVLRNFVATYNVAAAERVAKAFGLEPIKKKLKHDPRMGQALGKEAAGTSVAADPVKSRPTLPSDAATPNEKKALQPQASAALSTLKGDFKMERGSGRDRILQAQMSSKAPPDRLWEALTAYERFKLFIPDVLESEREGQDGSAIIVHMVSLSHWAFFVFKINLHLRIIERPAQKVIEFERIAGDFETFRGSFEIQNDSKANQSTIIFHSTLAPKGKMPDWMLQAMAKRFIMPKLAAFCNRAEAN